MTAPFKRSASGRAYPHIRKLYFTKLWRETRTAQLTIEPTCRLCRQEGRLIKATVCDHVTPHRGSEQLFWSGPFQSLCRDHHSSAKQREENQGFSSAVADDGWPTDPKHPANRRG